MSIPLTGNFSSNICYKKVCKRLYIPVREIEVNMILEKFMPHQIGLEQL